jgi:inosine/xanthosine triphosphatase
LCKIYIGSTNPVKIECTRKAFGLVFPEKKFEIIGVPVESGVSHQPFGEEKTLQGALNRVLQIKQIYPDATYWIGIEGGLDKIDDGMYAFAWIVVMNNQRSGKARTATFEIPGPLRVLIEKGYELGDADDKFFRRSNSKHNDGTVGRLTSGIIDRIEFYKHAMVLALIPFRENELYK